MNDNSRYLRLKRLMNPASLVFVGGAALEPAISYARALGFGGEFHAINPRRKQLAGIDCVHSVAMLPKPPDVAFVAVPGAAAIDAVRELSAAGVGAAIVNSSGFAETGEQGAALEENLLQAAGEMPLMGPNCPGIANFLDRFGAMLGHIGNSSAQRGVAVLANGGAWLADITASDRSLPIALVAGLGNQASLSIAELLEVILDDDRISAVNLHFECIRDVARLSQCALKAHQRGIPVVAIKAGRTEAGKRAASSHTGSMASDSAIASALFERLGFVEARSASEALETLKMLTLTAAPRGPRVALATSSGTYAVMGADFAESQGLSVAPLSEAIRDKLQALMADFLTANNPLDIGTTRFAPDEVQRKIFDCFLGDQFDIAVQSMSFPAEDTWADESWYRSATVFAQAAKSAGLPAAFVSPIQEGLPAKARDMLIELGVAPLQEFEQGMRAIAHALIWHQRRKRLKAENMLLPDSASTGPASGIQLDEAESKTLLDAHAVPVPRGRRVSARGELPKDIAFPVVLKVCDASILQKTEVGGVSLNLVNAELLGFAREQMIASLRQHGIIAQHFLVEESIRGALAELLVGIRLAPGIGYSLTMAIGGIAVELLNDCVNLLLPCDREQIRQALQSLKLYPSLCGLRGGSAADVDSALDAIEALAQFVQSRSDIVEVEINPLILRAEDHGAVAVDAVITIKPH
ncbi:MAG: acetate--CoA ligase family protein [Gammaproteobacteria bacterium]|nr:acetate--CoA ligase family protein [Gammaproteobacteria bacterium]